MHVIANLDNYRVHLAEGAPPGCHVTDILGAEEWVISPILGLPPPYRWCRRCQPRAEAYAAQLRAAGVGSH